MKFAVGLIVLTVFCGILYAQNHTVQWGTQTFNERMLDRQFVRKSSSWMKVVIEEVTWPNRTQARNNTITRIRAIDQFQNGKGAYASLSAGGVGYTNVTIRIKSQRGYGIDHIVEIYGH
uniref:Putative transcription activator mbf2 n=1 Tax=Nyssomyia neivai TaxID=330878 RepID=A0A1L8DG22_9DIPT